MLLLVFVHGFKGSDETFGDFPQRLEHLLTETIPDVPVSSLVFPAYETKGNLKEAVERFADWLTTITVQKEVASGGGAGTAKIVLCGHSMGGLLVADTLLELINTRPSKDDPLWPRIIACIAFDTPYLGIHPGVVKNTVSKAAEYAGAATTIGSAVFGALAGFGAKKATTSSDRSSNSTTAAPTPMWSKFSSPLAFAVGGAVLAGAAAGSAYYQQELNTGIAWATDHMKYVGNLWDEATLKKRFEALLTVERYGVVFRTFYAYIPPNPPFVEARTFVVLPKRTSHDYSYFIQARNTIAPDEIQAHTGIFGGKTNDGYYDLGLDTASIIREAFVGEGQTPEKDTTGFTLGKRD